MVLRNNRQAGPTAMRDGRERPRLLLADEQGRVFDHPELLAATVLDDQSSPLSHWIPLPEGTSLQALPGWLPLGIDPRSGSRVLVDRVNLAGRTLRPRAVGAVLPPGYTRAALPAGRRSVIAPTLPQWAYTAAAFGRDGFQVAAVRTDRREHWNPKRFSTTDLPARVEGLQQELPGNRVLDQLATCALRYRCFTAQNIFYGRDEGALPASTACNARCVGCISEQPASGSKASHERQKTAPLWQELATVGARHLSCARGRVMVSFGQGCEGEPLTRASELVLAIKAMRRTTPRGSININTNGSLPDALDALAQAGLDAARVSLNSAHAELYAVYYQPQGYGLEAVEAALGRARRRGLYLALNLLTFPGVTDREGEVDLLCELIRRHRVDQLQTRPLAIDPTTYVELARDRGAGGRMLGLREMLRRVRRAAPWVRIGNFSRSLAER
jgi:wyosine [tRNA(Phe)-imidazoG37] synthetase (radical SAM superfamily)